jgi:outer membrane lipoprotein-sorting protein
MKFLRTVSTRRLLALIVGFVSAVAAGTALALAATGNGPVPPAKPLPNAIHDALAAPKIQGITARVSFTNHLIDSTDIQGSDPILTGATGRVWLSADHRLRLELQSDNGDAQVLVNGRSFWIYDPTSNTAYEGQLPADATQKSANQKQRDKLPTIGQIQSDLGRLAQHANLSGAIPGDVAGRGAYTVRVSPKHDGGLLGAGELAWDALKGVPLRVAVYAKNDTSPVLELKATDISYGAVDPSVFNITPPNGAKIVKVKTPAAASPAAAAAAGASRAMHGVRGSKARHREISGAAAVARHLSFPLLAPKKLVGLPRRSVSLLDWGGSPAALISYGENLGGVAVIEQTADSAKGARTQKQGEHGGLSLPTVSINGTTAQELDTALGTMVRFTRGGVTYTVVGSVPPAAADLAARAL